MSGDIHALSGAYAVDAVDDIERAMFERHLAQCSDCRAEVDSLREAGAVIAETSAQTPPAALRDRVLAGVEAIRPLPPMVSAAAEKARSRRRMPALVAAAAALIALGAAGATVVHPWDSSSNSQLSASEQVLQADDAERVVTKLPGGGSATFVRSQALNKAIIVTDGMPAAPAGKTYELWFSHQGALVPAGQLAGGASTVVLDGDAASADGIGVTIEEAGARATSPSDDRVALVSFDGA